MRVCMDVRLPSNERVKLNTIESFSNLQLPLPLSQSLQKMKFETPTPVQAGVIPEAMLGKDILATAQTGTGKTAAFGIPMLSMLFENKRKNALILAPTRELAAQIHQVLKQLGQGMNLRGALVVGGESFRRQVDEMSRNIDYIIATPGRLNDHLQERTVDLSHADMIVFDEVDRMLDMGFIPQIRAIMRFVPTDRQTMLFSATLPNEILSLANSFLNKPVRIAIGDVKAQAPDVKEVTIQTTQIGKNDVLLKEMEAREGRILVFARTQSRTERVARMLYQKGHDVTLLHGGRSQAQRKQALESFRAGTRRIMVATDLAGRGIDVPNIEHVINYDLPQSREDYVHRIGRTGRMGKSGHALNLVTPADIEGEEIISGVKPKPRVVYRSPRRFGARRR